MSSERALSYDRYTYDDYIRWEAGFRCELIDGIVYMMSAPSVWHQRVVKRLATRLDSYLEGKKCESFIAPFDVRLFPKDNNSDDTVVQPDVIVVCDEKKVSDGLSCRGAPDVIFEVLSDSTKSMDLLEKRRLYERAGVNEYWVIGKGYAIRWILDGGKYKENKFNGGVNGIELEKISLNIKFSI